MGSGIETREGGGTQRIVLDTDDLLLYQRRKLLLKEQVQQRFTKLIEERNLSRLIN
jgi:hypothetical protein